MERQVVTVPPTMPADDVIELMLEKRIGCVPVARSTSLSTSPTMELSRGFSPRLTSCTGHKSTHATRAATRRPLGIDAN